MIAGIIFDKDGTLFDFQRTWGDWTRQVLRHLSAGVPETHRRLAAAIRFDDGAGRFHADSPAIAGTNAEVAILLASELPDKSEEEVLLDLNRLAISVPLAEAAPLVPLLSDLAGRGMRLGLATNDAEESARAHLHATGALPLFDQVFGYDSGFGAKPDPGMLLAFCDFEGLDPEKVAMVGDSRHDLLAGREAGMHTIGVLTGPADADELESLADEILPDIGHLPGSALLNTVRKPRFSLSAAQA